MMVTVGNEDERPDCGMSQRRIEHGWNQDRGLRMNEMPPFKMPHKDAVP